MDAARDGGSRHRAAVPCGSAAVAVCVLLAGCTGKPEPAPFQPSPTAASAPPPSAAATPPATATSMPLPATATATAPSTTATTTAGEPPSSSLHELKAMLEPYSEELLQEGALAVLIEAKVGPEEWSQAIG